MTEPQCLCLSPADALHVAFSGDTVAPCPVHTPPAEQVRQPLALNDDDGLRAAIFAALQTPDPGPSDPRTFERDLPDA